MPVATLKAILLGSPLKDEFASSFIAKNIVVQQAATPTVSNVPNKPNGLIPAAAIKEFLTIFLYLFGIAINNRLESPIINLRYYDCLNSHH